MSLPAARHPPQAALPAQTHEQDGRQPQPDVGSQSVHPQSGERLFLFTAQLAIGLSQRLLSLVDVVVRSS